MQIPNRVVALLIVMLFIAVTGAALYWLFSYNTASLSVTTDPIGATVTLEQKRTPLYERTADPIARFENIPALEYEMVTTASGYETDRRTVILKKDGANELGIRLLPEAYLEEEILSVISPESEAMPEARPQPTEEPQTEEETLTGTQTAGEDGESPVVESVIENNPSPAILVRQMPTLEIRSASGTLLYRHARA
ncbi:MAG TPA: hypothetical protein PK765_07670 [bacterium]|nr:hypothetical protein [bacterium]